MQITLSRGGKNERTVDLDKISIPDLWEIASIKGLNDYKLGGRGAGDLVLETWHLAHDLKRELAEAGEREVALAKAAKRLNSDVEQLTRERDALRAAAADFVAKCRDGRAASRDSRAKFEAALALGDRSVQAGGVAVDVPAGVTDEQARAWAARVEAEDAEKVFVLRRRGQHISYIVTAPPTGFRSTTDLRRATRFSSRAAVVNFLRSRGLFLESFELVEVPAGKARKAPCDPQVVDLEEVDR